jgi:serine/threonine protein kinase
MKLGDYVAYDVLETRGAYVWLSAGYRGNPPTLAVKLVAAQHRSDPDVIERFRHEAVIQARLTSRHSVALLDFGKTADGVLYQVVERVDGSDFADLGALPAADACRWIAEACDAVAEANTLGITHGHITTRSLRLVRSCASRLADRVVVLDFGLAGAPSPDADDVRDLVAALRESIGHEAVPPALDAVLARPFRGARDLAAALATYALPLAAATDTPPQRGVRDREIALVTRARAVAEAAVHSGVDSVCPADHGIAPALIDALARRWGLPWWALAQAARDLADRPPPPRAVDVAPPPSTPPACTPAPHGMRHPPVSAAPSSPTPSSP